MKVGASLSPGHPASAGSDPSRNGSPGSSRRGRIALERNQCGSIRTRALAVVLGLLLSWSILLLGFVLRFARVNRYFSYWWPSWGSGLALIWAFLSVLLVAALFISRWALRARSEHSPSRRAFLNTSRAAM